MHIERLIAMANDIAAFFHGAASHDEAVRGIATHLRNYWDPRMRKQIVEHCNAGGAGLSDLARAAVALLAKQLESGQPQLESGVSPPGASMS